MAGRMGGAMFSKVNFLQIFLLILLVVVVRLVEAARFSANYPCNDTAKTCLSSGTRIIDGFSVSRACWQYSYQKSCAYPSKNNCGQYNHCYLVANKECLLRDNLGNCVNQLKELSCKTWQPVTIEQGRVRVGLVAKDGQDRLVCKGVVCMDGNCIDQSYTTNSEMMDSISKLSAISQMKGVTDVNCQLFTGFASHCSKKATSYTNCCSTSLKGWGNNLGAKCTKDEVDLIDKRRKNLCVYVGKENIRALGVTTVVKHHYCCFGSLLNKVIQVEGRKQLGINFGSGGSPNCRGLTLSEIMRLDFEKIDFSEFFGEIAKKLKMPKTTDIDARVKSALPNIRQYDGNPENPSNKKSGVAEILEQQGGHESQENQ